MEKDEHKELWNSSAREMIDLEPLRNYSRMNNKWRKRVSYRNEPYPEDLNPFLGDYPDTLNPFLDEKEEYPDEMNPFIGDSEDSEIVVEAANMQNIRDEQHRGESIEDIRSESSFQANSPSGSLNNLSDVISLDCLFSPLRKISEIPPNFDKTDNEYSTDSQGATQDNSKQDGVNIHEQIEIDKVRYKENISEKIVSPLEDDGNSEVIQLGSSRKTAPVPPAVLNDPKEREMETCKVEKVSDINNMKDYGNQIKRGNSLTHIHEDNIVNNTVGVPSLASTESGKKDKKAKCLSSSTPKAENIMESLVVENCDRLLSSVRPSKKKRRAPHPPPLQNQIEATTQEIGCSRNASKMAEINIMKETAATPPRPQNRCGEKMKKDDSFPVSKDVAVPKPTRPAPPVPTQYSQKADAGKKGVRGFWKRILHRKK